MLPGAVTPRPGRAGFRYKEDHRVTSRTDHRRPYRWGGAGGWGCLHHEQGCFRPPGPGAPTAVRIRDPPALKPGAPRTPGPDGKPVRLLVLVRSDDGTDRREK